MESYLKFINLKFETKNYLHFDRYQKNLVHYSICITVEAEVKGTPAFTDTLEISEVKEFAVEELPLGNSATITIDS